MLKQFPSILICEVVHMQGRKYINLVEMYLVVLEIQKAEFGNFALPVNNTLVCHTSIFVFLAADTLVLLSVLIYIHAYIHARIYTYIRVLSIVVATYSMDRP